MLRLTLGLMLAFISLTAGIRALALNPPVAPQLAYVSWDSDLVLLDVSRAFHHNLTRSLEREITATWSPDGASLAYTVITGDLSTHIRLLNLETGFSEEVSRQFPPVSQPRWSSDNRHLAFTVMRGSGVSFVADVSCIQSEQPCPEHLTRQMDNRLSGGLFHFVMLQPNGQGMIAVTDDGLYRLDPNSLNPSRISPLRVGEMIASPNGYWVLVTAYTDSVQGEIYRMEGACLWQAESCPAHRLTHNQMTEAHLAWSPDGRTIALVGQVEGWFQLFLMDAACVDATCQPRQITDAPLDHGFPQWSSDSTRIALLTLTGNQDHLLLFDEMGQPLNGWTDLAVNGAPAAWRPQPPVKDN